MKSINLNNPVNLDLTEQIFNLIKNKENITLLWLPKSSRTSFASKLKSKDILKNIIPDNILQKLIFVVLDFSLNDIYFEKHLEESLGEFSPLPGIRSKVLDIINKGCILYFVVDNFNFKNPSMLKYLLSFRYVNPEKVIYIFSSLESDFYDERVDLSDFSLIYENIIQIPYYDKTEVFDWIELNTDTSLNMDQKESVYEFCGGIHGLIKHTINLYERYKDLDKVFKSKEMDNFIYHLWDRFTKKEKYILKSIYTMGKIPPYTSEVNYLKEHKLIIDNKINGKWLERVIKNRESIKIRLMNNEIIWEGIIINEALTDSEIKIFKYLIENINKFITRDDLSNIIWEENSTEKYSDWALDQLVSRLRKKLDKIGIGGDVVETIKGKGFKLSNINILK